MKRVFVVITACIYLYYSSIVYSQSSDTQKLPAITILSPQEGVTIFGDTVEIVFVVNNFHLVEPENQLTTKDGQGHIAMYLDDPSQDYINSAKITKLSPLTLENIEGGTHTLVMELVDNKGNSLKPKAIATLEFTSIDKPTGSFKPSVSSEPIDTQKQTVQSGADTLILFVSVTIGALLFLGGAAYLLVLKNKR